MPNRRAGGKVGRVSPANKDKEATSPRTAKIVLFIFGIGPLLLMAFFLSYNGFFTSP